MNDDINVVFIIPLDCRSENDCSEEMQLAFTVRLVLFYFKIL